ncbi:MAG TPA: hypothetical protein VF297_12495 [Pyrinomonadaceae bacterium]
MSETRIDPSVKPTPNVQTGEGGPAPKSVDAPHGPRNEDANPTRSHVDNGRGNAYGHTNKPARIREIESRSQLVRNKLDGSQRGGRHDGLEQQHGTDAGRNTSHAHGGHEPRGNAEGWSRRGLIENLLPTREGGKSHAGGNPHDVLSPRADVIHPLVSTARDYLNGLTRGEALSPEMRKVLDGAAGFLGRDFIARTGHGVGKKDVGLAERVLAHVSRQLEKASVPGGPSHRPTQDVVRAGVRNILEAAHLERYFAEQGKRGGDVVRQAEAAVARALYGGPEADNGASMRIFAHEVLRDLRSGAFVPVEETYNPFPLTGRARVVTEMMELMRVLDAVESAWPGGEVAPGEGPDALLVAFMKGEAGLGTLGALDELLASLLPALPGRAARLELLRFVAALGGMLTDPQGRQLTAKDGTPLKLEQLLWLGLPSGLMQSSFMSERSPVQLSPLLVYGFDALYSVIGFDGRTIGAQHFAAVQAQVNGSELEWVFGQPPLTEGWMRALIERLKDSASADHNLLGEMLEEALADGRLHAVLVSGRVEEGEPVADSFSVSGLLPGASAEAAFSPA